MNDEKCSVLALGATYNLLLQQWITGDLIHMIIICFLRNKKFTNDAVILEYSRFSGLFDEEDKDSMTNQLYKKVYGNLTSKVKKKKIITLFDKKIWLVPENVDDSHWVLRVICNPLSLFVKDDNNKFCLWSFDSQGNHKSKLESKAFWSFLHYVFFYENKSIKETMDGIKSTGMKKSLESNSCYTFLNNNPSPIKRYNISGLPEQKNTFDCGPFCILFAIRFIQCYIIEPKKRKDQLLAAPFNEKEFNAPLEIFNHEAEVLQFR